VTGVIVKELTEDNEARVHVASILVSFVASISRAMVVVNFEVRVMDRVLKLVLAETSVKAVPLGVRK
jgi:hypothetical protein